MGVTRPISVLFCLRGDRRRASSRVRGYWIADELERLGLRCTLLNPRRGADYLRMAAALLRHDVVIFQKRQASLDLLMLKLARRLGCQTYYDIDDAPRGLNPKRLANTEAIMRLADGVFAGSSNLVALARRHSAAVHLVPTGVMIANYAPRPEAPSAAVPCLGWIGNGADYAPDLVAILKRPLERVAAVRPLRLKIVGACGVSELHTAFSGIAGLEADVIDQIAWADPQAVQAEMADFDIGLYPLLDKEFNRYKCGFKALEYMARGLPVIASRVGGTSDIVGEGMTGYLASGEEQWCSALDRLTAAPGLCAEFGHQGRLRVEQDFATSRIAAGLLALFEAGRAAR